MSGLGRIVLRAVRAPTGADEAVPGDYEERGELVDEEPLPAAPGQRFRQLPRRECIR